MLYEQILKEQSRLEHGLQSVQAQLQMLPEGNLVCSHNQNRYKWYISNGHTKVYLPKKEQQLAEQLAAKKYLTALQHDLLLICKDTYCSRSSYYPRGLYKCFFSPDPDRPLFIRILACFFSSGVYKGAFLPETPSAPKIGVSEKNFACSDPNTLYFPVFLLILTLCQGLRKNFHLPRPQHHISPSLNNSKAVVISDITSAIYSRSSVPFHHPMYIHTHNGTISVLNAIDVISLE